MASQGAQEKAVFTLLLVCLLCASASAWWPFGGKSDQSQSLQPKSQSLSQTPPLPAAAAANAKPYSGVLDGAERYSRYCLNSFAPRELGLPATYGEHDEFCKKFTTDNSTAHDAEDLRRAAKTPEPHLRDSYLAELAGHLSHNSQSTVKSMFIEVTSQLRSNPALLKSKWPTRHIPYFIDASVSKVSKVRFNWALNSFEQRTCVVFVATKKDKPWLPPSDPSPPTRRFVVTKSAEDSCFSHTGVLSDANDHQLLHFGDRCSVGSALHVIMHLLGFGHTPQRSDRDAYVTYDDANTASEYRILYQKMSPPAKDFGRYDYFSVMHPDDGVQTIGDVDTAKQAAGKSSVSFSILVDKSKPNLIPKSPASGKPPHNSKWDGRAQRMFLSVGDVEGIHELYCPEVPIPAAPIDEQSILFPKGVAHPKPTTTNQHPHLEAVECYHQAGDHDLYVPGTGDCHRNNFFWMCTAHPDCQNSENKCACHPNEKFGCDGQCFCQSNRWLNECRCMKPMNPKTQFCVNGNKPTPLAID